MSSFLFCVALSLAFLPVSLHCQLFLRLHKSLFEKLKTPVDECMALCLELAHRLLFVCIRSKREQRKVAGLSIFFILSGGARSAKPPTWLEIASARFIVVFTVEKIAFHSRCCRDDDGDDDDHHRPRMIG
jgi:hypothetical protein